MDCNQTENKESIIANVQKFMQDGCGCRRGLKSSQCSDQLTEETVLDNLYNCLELSHVELDLVVLANIQAFTAIEAIREKRKRSPPYSFLYRSQPICKEMFLNLYGISKSRFQRLVDHDQIIVFLCEYTGTARDYHITRYHWTLLRISKTF